MSEFDARVKRIQVAYDSLMTPYYETKVEDAKTFSKQMSQIYRGLSRRMTQHGLNSMMQQQKVTPHFQGRICSAINLRYRDIKSVYEGVIHSIVV